MIEGNADVCKELVVHEDRSVRWCCGHSMLIAKQVNLNFIQNSVISNAADGVGLRSSFIMGQEQLSTYLL